MSDTFYLLQSANKNLQFSAIGNNYYGDALWIINAIKVIRVIRVIRVVRIIRVVRFIRVIRLLQWSSFAALHT
jgi:hypothetical protein